MDVARSQLKIGNDYELVRYIESKIINEKYSPDAVIEINEYPRRIFGYRSARRWLCDTMKQIQ